MMKHKKIIRKLILLGLSVFFLFGVSHYYKKESHSSKISAHPTNKVKLDSGVADEYNLQEDDTKLWETILTSDPLYKGYVQNEVPSVSVSKGVLGAYSTKQQDVVSMTEYLGDNKYLMSIATRNDNDAILNTAPARMTLTIAIFDGKTGEITDNKNMVTGMPTDTNNTIGNGPQGDYAGGESPFLKETDGSYSYIYTGRSNNILVGNNALRKINFKVDALKKTIQNVNWQDITQNITTNNQLSTLIKPFVGETGNQYYSYGYVDNRNGNPNEGNDILYLENNVFKLKKHLKIPNKINYLKVGGTFWGSWLSSPGYDSVNGGFFGKMDFRNTINQYNSYLGHWNDNGELLELVPMGENIVQTGLRTFRVMEAISTTSELYLTKIYAEKTELVKQDLRMGYGSNKQQVLLSFPKNSSIGVSETLSNFGKYMIYGQYGDNGGVLAEYGIKKGDIYIGVVDEDFNILSARGINATGTVSISNIIAGQDTDNLFLYGYGTSRDFTNKPKDGWKESYPGSTVTEQNALYGLIKLVPDYAPAIKSTSNQINIEKKSKEQIQQELLTNVSVYDSYELSPGNLSGQKDMKWLRERINKNPNKIVYDADGVVRNPNIDWDTLGLDTTKTGPQHVTFFVSDDNKKSSVTSNVINALTDKTKEKDNYYLDVANFSIHVDDVATSLSTDDAIKKLAQTKAWNGKDAIYDEDSTKSPPLLSSKVVFTDTNQLTTLRQATVAKPYPLDIEYKGSTTTTVKNRIWVFVTDDRTVVDEANDVVIYAKDYTQELRLADQETNNKIWVNSEIKVYQFKANAQTGDVPPVLADKDNITGLGVNSTDKATINSATLPGDYPNIRLTFTKKGKVIEAPITIKLIRDPLTIHYQQVVINRRNELVVPTEGFAKAINGKDALLGTTTSTKEELSIKGPSRDGDMSSYNKILVSLADDHWYYYIIPVIPEYYEWVGFQLTDTNLPHNELNKSTGQIVLNGKSQSEYWVTVYLTPSFSNSETPRYYGWNYGKNGIYEINP
ncbi:hypothetical protein I6N95_24770 [Vagococcus sp. BWB3-3]|uniref:MucBP domain-containing protein n=1 Tax=Vagococcus allomyrinae TaxID=2794353 RepID=A0A940PAC7_9ENTE|nr:hypothetical protein [Vagococcus allomyrinae]MBP1044227.1 hypothetical protein [Vagococcus allomyrinae]